MPSLSDALSKLFDELIKKLKCLEFDLNLFACARTDLLHYVKKEIQQKRQQVTLTSTGYLSLLPASAMTTEH